MRSNRDDALLLPLAAGADDLLLKLDVFQVEADQLADPEAGAVERLEDCSVSGAPESAGIGDGEETEDLLLGEEVGEVFLHLRSANIEKGIPAGVPLPLEVSEVTANRGELPYDCGLRVFLGVQVGEKATNLVDIQIDQLRELGHVEVFLELLEVVGVRPDRLRAQVALIS